MSLPDVFFEIKIPQTENPNLFNAIALSDFPLAKIGVNYLGFPVILISSKFDKDHLSKRNIKLKYIELTNNLECRISENGKSKIGNYSVIIFKSNEETLQNYFLGIVQSLLTSLSKNPSQKEVLETFKNFVEIFRSLNETPTKTIQGLWAELILIEQSKKPETLINYWHSIPKEKFDFNADSEKIEVKSSSNLERVHIFTSEQLNPINDCQVVIASILTKQVSNGLNILDLLDKIDKRIVEIELKEEVFRIVAKSLGNSFEQTTKINGHLMRNHKKCDGIKDKVIEGHNQVEHVAKKCKPHRVSLGLE